MENKVDEVKGPKIVQSYFEEDITPLEIGVVQYKEEDPPR